MNLSPYEIALIAGGFTIIGALIGAWIGYRNALKLHNVAEFNKAAATFRSAFAPEIAQIRLIASGKRITHPDNPDLKGGDYIHFFLSSALRNHARAVEEFSPYVPEKKKEAYYGAWEKYYQSGFHDYYMGEKPYELFFERIQAILQFTE